jgi:biopolymer transport protein ExbB/TolQ
VENYLIAILVIVTILLIAQAVVWVGLFFLAKRLVLLAERAGQLQTRAEYLLNNTEPVLKTAQGLMHELKEAAEYFTQGAQHITAIAEMAKDEAADVRSLLGDTTALARREVERTRERVDQVQTTLEVATDQFQRVTGLVQRSVLEPAREFSYIMYGLRRALEALMASNRLPVNRAYQDEEMFI